MAGKERPRTAAGRVAGRFVALNDARAITGFYTLAATSVAVDKLPSDLTKRLPRYPLMPAVLMEGAAIKSTHELKQWRAIGVNPEGLRTFMSKVTSMDIEEVRIAAPAAALDQKLATIRKDLALFASRVFSEVGTQLHGTGNIFGIDRKEGKSPF
jgi:hypothetical protein